MRILLSLTYYRPHISGLTIYVERLAEVLARRGHRVTVLTSRHDRSLPRRESRNGVRIVRVPAPLRVGKGVVMPTLGVEAVRELRRHDVASLHLPQLDAWGIALRCRLLRRPCVLTYHCDLRLPEGRLNRAAEWALAGSHAIAARCADRIVSYTADYAHHSPFLVRHRAKVQIIPPPVVMPEPAGGAADAFRNAHALGAGPLVGLAARFAAEKGIDTLAAALRKLLRERPDATVVFAGPRDVPGEEAYRDRLGPLLDAFGARWRFVGSLDPVAEMPAFFRAVDCLVVPSVNSTESFGLVQVEAMLCGTPVVASDLPGVRAPVRVTGMGEVVPPGDADALAVAVARVLDSSAKYVRPRAEIAALFDPDRVAVEYEALFGATLARARLAARVASP